MTGVPTRAEVFGSRKSLAETGASVASHTLGGLPPSDRATLTPSDAGTGERPGAVSGHGETRAGSRNERRRCVLSVFFLFFFYEGRTTKTSLLRPAEASHPCPPSRHHILAVSKTYTLLTRRQRPRCREFFPVQTRTSTRVYHLLLYTSPVDKIKSKRLSTWRTRHQLLSWFSAGTKPSGVLHASYFPPSDRATLIPRDRDGRATGSRLRRSPTGSRGRQRRRV